MLSQPDRERYRHHEKTGARLMRIAACKRRVVHVVAERLHDIIFLLQLTAQHGMDSAAHLPKVLRRNAKPKNAAK